MAHHYGLLFNTHHGSTLGFAPIMVYFGKLWANGLLWGTDFQLLGCPGMPKLSVTGINCTIQAAFRSSSPNIWAQTTTKIILRHGFQISHTKAILGLWDHNVVIYSGAYSSQRPMKQWLPRHGRWPSPGLKARKDPCSPLLSDLFSKRTVSKKQAPSLGVLIRRMIVRGGLFWGPLLLETPTSLSWVSSISPLYYPSPLRFALH